MDIRPPDNVMAWAGPILLINIFVWMLIVTPESADALCSDSDNCLTDWLSATSGWGAVFAAVLTVHFFQKQIDDANRFNTRSIKIQLRKTAAIARRAMRQAQDLELVAKRIAQECSANGDNMDITSLAFYLKRLETEASNPTFDIFEDEIGTEHPTALKKLRMHIEATQRDHKELIFVKQVPPVVLAMSVLETVKGYSKMVASAAEAFLAEEREMTNSAD